MSSTEMKSYLSLIPISAKVRRRQNRMTILCIVLAVFLVTAVFSMADMAIRMETSNQLNKNGNWHIMVKDISPETAAELAAQEDVAAFSAYSDINASLTENYFAGDKRAALVGADDAILQIFPGMQCSTAPADGEVLVTANIRNWLDNKCIRWRRKTFAWRISCTNIRYGEEIRSKGKHHLFRYHVCGRKQ